MSDERVKANVRDRDGYQCRDCGMTRDQHIAECGRDLDVHRLIPGSIYHESMCVTLCRACHGTKPKTISRAWWKRSSETGTYFYFLNLYDAQEAAVYDTLREHAKAQDLSTAELIDQILLDFHKAHTVPPGEIVTTGCA